MLDNKTLSKQKFIYYVYESDKTIHIEKFPIVYINSKYVYYKHSRKHELEKVYISFPAYFFISAWHYLFL